MQIRAMHYEPGQHRPPAPPPTPTFPWIYSAPVTTYVAPSQSLTWKSRGSLQ